MRKNRKFISGIDQEEWEKLKTKKEEGNYRQRLRKFKTVIYLIIVNIILLSCVGVIFTTYENQNMEKRWMDHILGSKEEGTIDISRQITRTIDFQEKELENIVAFMETAKLSKEMVEVFIDNMHNVDGALSIVQLETREVYSGKIANADRNQKLLLAVEEAYANQDSLTYQMTDSFDLEGNDHQSVAFFCPIVIGGDEYLLVQTIPLNHLFEGFFKMDATQNAKQMIVNEEGEVLVGEGVGFNEYLTENFDAKMIEKLDESMQNQSEGRTELKDQQGENIVFVFTALEGLYDWRYLHISSTNLGVMSQEAVGFMIAIVVLMGLICVIDVGVIFMQNRRLYRGISVIEAKNTELEQVNRTKDIFISSMSHEIRTPINAILGMDEMILRESTEEPVLEYGRNIKNAGKSLLGIVNDILDFTKLESEKLELIVDRYDIASVVNDLYVMSLARAREKNLEFLVKVDQDLPHILLGDELRLKQIILNLITNAIKYTEHGTVEFSMNYEKRDEDSILLKVAVKDTGIGIKEEERDKLYKPFERLDEKRNRSIEGTGLGLSIVIRLLQQMDSQLKVESVYGEGSEFSFAIVQKVLEWQGVGSLEQMIEDSKLYQKEEKQQLFAPKAKVLVVDDNTTNLCVVEGLLKRTLVELDTATSGEEGLKCLENTTYDIILLDHRMPGMDGVETMHHIRKMEHANRSIPIIALTANAMASAKDDYLKEGFDGFLSKPVSGTKLEKMIQQYLPKDLLWNIGAGKIRVEDGLRNCGSREIYLQTLENFIMTAAVRIKEITRYYEQEDWENYTVKVHALKSAARLVGMNELSKQAEYLEKCGNEGKIEEIHKFTKDLLERYHEVMEISEELVIDEEEMIGVEAIDCKGEGISADFLEFLAKVDTLNEAFDYDGIDQLMAQRQDCSMSVQERKIYQTLKVAVYDVNQEAIRAIVSGSREA